MSARDRLKRAARACFATQDGLVWLVRKVKTVDLLDAGTLQLLGPGDAAEALQVASSAAVPEQLTPEQQAEAAEAKARALMRHLTASSERLRAALQQADAFVLAGVVGVAELPEGVRCVPGATESNSGIVQEGAWLSVDDYQFEPLTVVDGDPGSDPEKVRLADISQSSRAIISRKIQEHTSAIADVRMFRRESASIAAYSEGGSRLREVAS